MAWLEPPPELESEDIVGKWVLVGQTRIVDCLDGGFRTHWLTEERWQAHPSRLYEIVAVQG